MMNEHEKSALGVVAVKPTNKAGRPVAELVDRMGRLADDWLPTPRILHPWPDKRFAVNHPR